MVHATQLSAYLYCPRKIFIKSVLKVEEAPKEALIKGTVWHYTHELLNTQEESIVKSITTNNYQDIFLIYRKECAKILRNAIIRHKSGLKEFTISLLDIFKEYWPFLEEEAKERATNVSQFIKKHNLFGEELWNKLTPKLKSEQRFAAKNIDLSGIIDILEVHTINGEEQYVPIELKTGKFPAKGMWDSHRIQLAAYMILLQENGLVVPEAVIKYKDAGEKRILVMNSLLHDEVLDLIKKVKIIIDEQQLPGRIDNKNKCTSCSFKELCYDDAEMQKRISVIEKKL